MYTTKEEALKNSNPDLTGWEDVIQIIGEDENNESHDEY